MRGRITSGSQFFYIISVIMKLPHQQKDTFNTVVVGSSHQIVPFVLRMESPANT
jgi:hypothetical protein